MRYEIFHKTEYAYDYEVSVAHHVARLTPRDLPQQRREAHTLEVDPPAVLQVNREDYFGNTATFLSVEGPHRKFKVLARSRVEVLPRTWPEASRTLAWECVREGAGSGNAPTAGAAVEFVFASPLIPYLPALKDYAQVSFPAGRPILEAILELTERVHADFVYDAVATTVATPLDKVIRERRGVCQDFAHFQIGCLRSLGLPARYVSGYLETLPPPGQTKLAGADASHAWLECFLPEIGWIGVDPTNNLLPGERHITVAWGRDFEDVSPIRGVIVGGGKHNLRVAVDVIPVESPLPEPGGGRRLG